MTAHDVSGSSTTVNRRLNLFSGFQALDSDAFRRESRCIVQGAGRRVQKLGVIVGAGA
jgi:hypothetical protein